MPQDVTLDPLACHPLDLARILSAGGIVLWDHEHATGHTRWSPAFTALLGWPLEELGATPTGWLGLVHPLDRSELRARTQAALAHDGPRFEARFRMRHRDGRWRWVRGRGQVIERDPLTGQPRRSAGVLGDSGEWRRRGLGSMEPEPGAVTGGDAHGEPRHTIDTHTNIEARNRRLAAIIEASSDLIATATPEGYIDYLNPAGRALLGIGPLESVTQRQIEQYHPPWAYRRVRDEGFPAARRQGQWLGETALLGADGSEIPVSQLILAPRDPATGDIEYLATVCRDLSERLQGETALRALQREQELILDNVPALIWYKDTHNRQLRVNAAVARSLGLPKERIEGRHCADFYPEDAARYYQDDLAVIRSGAPRLGIEEPQRLPSGEQRWIRTDKVPIEDDTGEVIGILVMAIDITEQKQAEEALRLSQKDLHRAQSVAQVGSWRLDVSRNALAWSAETYRLFGIPSETPLTYETFLSAVHPDDRERVDQAWRAAFGGEPYDIEHRVLVDGRVKWLREQAELEFDDQGRLVGGFGTVQDVTSRRANEAALREADRRKDEFLATLAHELRNPLAPLRNAADVLRLPGASETQRANACALLERQLAHLTRLVDDLLDLSRIQRGEITLRPERLEVADIVAQAVETSRPWIDVRRQVLTLDLPSSVLFIQGDATRLVQVIANLLNNAAKYTEPGGRIRLQVAPEGDSLVLCVQDTGRGMSAALQGRVFDLFVRGESASDQSDAGLGIGLSLAQHLVTLHGGTITAHSAGAGQGSEFVVRLPLHEAPCPREETPAPACPLPPHRILIADDDPDVADGLALLLVVLGQEVQVAHDGLEALQIAPQYQPDLILLDLSMPRMDGHETCQRLRAILTAPAPPIVALSGLGLPQHLAATQAAGFDRHLVKPASLADLRDLLASLPAPQRRAD